MSKLDFSSYEIQKDNYRQMWKGILIAVLSDLVIISIYGFNNDSLFISLTIDIPILIGYYSYHNRYCEKCNNKMRQDFSNGLICENHYCSKCNKVVKMFVVNGEG
jgi:hypothetical protein